MLEPRLACNPPEVAAADPARHLQPSRCSTNTAFPPVARPTSYASAQKIARDVRVDVDMIYGVHKQLLSKICKIIAERTSGQQILAIHMIPKRGLKGLGGVLRVQDLGILDSKPQNSENPISKVSDVSAPCGEISAWGPASCSGRWLPR